MEMAATEPDYLRIRPEGRRSVSRMCGNSLLITVCGCEGTRFDRVYIAAKCGKIHP
jgi:hypothetical protein